MEFDISTIANALANNSQRSISDEFVYKIAKQNVKNNIRQRFGNDFSWEIKQILDDISRVKNEEEKKELLEKFGIVKKSIPSKIKSEVISFFEGGE